ncbi:MULTISPECIES: septum site-determining protein MinC [unclassified Shewanella]|uniref:septum site-determining protein MinC n=1 Tax=unclassified Shewanella TaxID=196818 RepID=UPI000970D6C1|nr:MULTISPECIES: septum site-determining protein MinC [unclassified Shewanella]MDO6619298.1 septum site-determining protein MinC [Shewanella sp. 6_MG-2023]MDO6640782.1 septum site-determining protein MinC [Shewanella sp. 5_MG-2023]MDO6776095.1 septum site-determining protein MinC [Shewanella sp. 3_MG-2023]PMG28691.1 septum site-determining protein MinC [Shewanella sp. 10N.286.52.C2]PMG46093.1 septum site-determining protein MinC [Shewanella sp. 10N.286.52.B9]
MATQSLELKATSFTLSVLHINTHDFNAIAADLESKLSQAPQFFIGAPLILNLSAIEQENINLAALKQLLTDNQLIIVGVTSANESISSQAKLLGLAVVKSGKQAKSMPAPLKETKIVKQNIRSGQQIYAKNADLVIFGAVGNGAEVIADGSIHIYGALRGKAMAGASGDVNSIIIANALDPELVSIAGQYWLAEHLQQNCSDQRGCIRLNGETLMVESLPQ